MDFGNFNRRINIERLQRIDDPLGDGAATWQPLVSVWADCKIQSGSEALRADTPVATTRGSFRIRWREGIQQTDRVIYAGAVFSILAVLPDMRGREYVDLTVESGANNG